MEFLLLRSHKEDNEDEREEEVAGVDEKIAVATIVDPRLGQIEVSAIPLRRLIPGWLAKSNNRVFHAVNGQVQFKQTRGYLSQSCGFPLLKDRVVIIVDASKLTFAAHNDVWKGDRERIRNTIVGERYTELITVAIRESQALKELQLDIASEELRQTAHGSNPLQKLLDSDGNLAGLLSDHSSSVEKRNMTANRRFEGKISPTFLRFGNKSKALKVDIPLNRSRAAIAQTDAENGYLQRPNNKGQVLVGRKIGERFTVRTHLYNGHLIIHFEAIKGAVKVGDKFKLKVRLHDGLMRRPVGSDLILNISDGEKLETAARKRAAKIADNQSVGKGSKDRLPEYRLLTNDGRKVGDQETERWAGGLSKMDGGIMQDRGKSGVLYKINYDNVYHLKYRLQQRSEAARELVTQKYILGMRILMLGFERAYRSRKRQLNGKRANVAKFANEFRIMAARGASSTVLALTEDLPKIIDTASVVAENVE